MAVNANPDSMQPFVAADLLHVWERGQGQPAALRAALLLAMVLPGTSVDELLNLEISRRDILLLTLRERAFGRRMPALLACPTCGERLEVELDAAQLRLESSPAPEQIFEYMEAGCRVRFRLPGSLDLQAVAHLPDLASARHNLVRRCIVEQEPAGGELSEAAESAVAQAMARAEESRIIQLAATCPACGHAWSVAFDIATYLWAEIEHWAVRLMSEVHWLASTYGWSEESILKMSALRRQHYLQMIAGGSAP